VERCPKILIAASGTGGHLFPALEIGLALKAHKANCIVEFIGSGRSLEETIIVSRGFKRHIIKTVGVKRRGFRGLFEFFFTLPKAFSQVWRLISEFKPDIIVGVGGYVTFLPIVIGWLRGVKSWVHEAELSPGLANYLLSFIATKVSIGVKEAKMPKSSNVVFLGHPVRQSLTVIGDEQGPFPAPTNLLVMGGSQGANALDMAMQSLAPFLKEKGFSLIHQCRAENIEILKSFYAENKIQATLMKFIEDTAAAYSWANLVISRSGAGATMELSVVNRPCILVPYPFAQGNHQKTNAMKLVSAGKALLVEEGAGFEAALKEALTFLCNEKNYNEMRMRPYEGRVKDAAQRIADAIVALIAL